MTLVLPSPSNGERVDDDYNDHHNSLLSNDRGKGNDDGKILFRHRSKSSVSSSRSDYQQDDDDDDDDHSDDATNTVDEPSSVSTTNTGWNTTTDIDDVESVNQSQLDRFVDTIIKSFTPKDDETCSVSKFYEDDDDDDDDDGDDEAEEEEYDDFVVKAQELDLAKNRQGLILSPNASRLDVSEEVIMKHSMTWASTFGWNDTARTSLYHRRGKDDERDLRMIENDKDERDLRIVESSDDDESRSTLDDEHDSRDDQNDEEDGEYDEEETWVQNEQEEEGDSTTHRGRSNSTLISMSKFHHRNGRDAYVSKRSAFFVRGLI
jgi:hypothetical protein